MTRRDALRMLAFLPATVVAEAARAQGSVTDTSNFFVMDQSAALPVRLPPKPVPGPALSADERDAVERRLRCQCGCTMDVYRCRTSDLLCQVAPAMHRDVSALALGGHGAGEILDAFAAVYGDRVLMAPPMRGFNSLAYLLPGVGTLAGIVGLALALRQHRREPS